VKPLALAAFLALTAVAGPLAAETPGRVLVMPFENVTRESRIFWLGEASAVLLADDLNALGATALVREERREAFERLQVPPAATLTDATVIRIGQLVGASHVIVGTLKLEGDTLVVRARSIALEVGRIDYDVTERGPIPELFATFERLARRMVPPAARESTDIASANPPIAAFENYIKGVLAATPATAISYLNSALKLSPTFGRARLALWDVYSAQGDHDRALAAVQRVAADSPWARRARFRAGLSQIILKKYDDAFATYKALLDERSDPAVLNNLGVVQLRRSVTSQSAGPTYYFNKAAEADATDPVYFFNLGYAYWMDRDPGAALHWLREALRRDQADADAHFVLGAALAATGNAAEANRERELARRLSATYEAAARKPGAPANDVVPKELERVKGDVALPHAPNDTTLAGSGQRDQRELAQFYLDRGRRLFQEERDREALEELNRALFLSPYQAEAHLLAGRIHLRGGRVHDAIDALKISVWSAETAEAHAVLAAAYLEAKEIASARAEAERALALDPGSIEAKRVLDTAARP
jgi:tetratricopeptide (TPR) repeat protein